MLSFAFVKIHYIVVRLRKLKLEITGMLPKKKKKTIKQDLPVRTKIVVWDLTWWTAQLSSYRTSGKVSLGKIWLTINSSAPDSCYPVSIYCLIKEVYRFSTCLLTSLLSFRGEFCKVIVYFFSGLLPSQDEMSLEIRYINERGWSWAMGISICIWDDF